MQETCSGLQNRKIPWCAAGAQKVGELHVVGKLAGAVPGRFLCPWFSCLGFWRQEMDINLLFLYGMGFFLWCGPGVTYFYSDELSWDL